MAPDNKQQTVLAGIGALIVATISPFVWQYLPTFVWKVSEKVAVDTAADVARQAIDGLKADQKAPQLQPQVQPEPDPLPPPPAVAEAPEQPLSAAIEGVSPIDTSSIMEQPNNSSIATQRAPLRKPHEDELLLDRWHREIFGDEPGHR